MDDATNKNTVPRFDFSEAAAEEAQVEDLAEGELVEDLAEAQAGDSVAVVEHRAELFLRRHS
jgi:hypothetical protein